MDLLHLIDKNKNRFISLIFGMIGLRFIELFSIYSFLLNVIILEIFHDFGRLK